MHPGQIEVNEITGYWTFLLSVSIAQIPMANLLTKSLLSISDRLEGPMADCPHNSACTDHKYSSTYAKQYKFSSISLSGAV